MNLLERIYLFLYTRKKNKHLRNRKRLPFPVISVGNLTLGGTGKTPFTIELARESIKRGFNPIILTRGYKGKLRGPLTVSSEYEVEEVGDEPLLMVEEGLKVFKGKDRYETGEYAIERLGLTKKDKAFFILDDGFQHWLLHRDLEILLIDGTAGFGNSKLFPLGPLRSPLEEINRADLVFITKRENQQLVEKIRKLGARKIYFSPLKIQGLRDERGDLISAEGKKAFVFAGIGNFKSFLDVLGQININVVGYKRFIDHKFYSEGTVRRLIRNSEKADLLITTKKDFIKIRKYLSYFKGKICYLQISLEIPKQAMEIILRHLEQFYLSSY